MVRKLTKEERNLKEDILLEFPIDHQYDEEYELLDGDIPLEQCVARLAKEALEQDDNT